MSEWRRFVLEDLLAEPLRNGVYKPKEHHGSGTKIVNMGELFGNDFISNQEMKRLRLSDVEKSKLLIRDGDILFARRSVVLEGSGKCALVVNPLEDTTFESSIIRARPNRSVIDPRFLFYSFRAPYLRAAVAAISSQTAVSGVRGSDLARLTVVVPPLAEQQRIVSILVAYDDLIRNCEQRIRVLDEMAWARFREWLTAAQATSRLVPAQQLIDERVLEINDGYRAKNSELGAPGLPFVRAGNIDAGFHFEDADVLSAEYLERAGSKVSNVGDVLFTSKGTVGRFAKVRARTPRFVYSPQICFWRVRDADVLTPNYLFRWMQTREFLDQVDRVKGSTDMADYVSLTNQRRMSVRVPDRTSLLEAEKMLGPPDDLTGVLMEQAAILRRTRDILLVRLLSGQLMVAEAA
ncbi:restriction endonuclease subunit S [Anaeromyxobacter oryzisoli]|uniref:restriction endonuclease subunit S n=1 Tax=Anaeromyxobacter oryzisoli TaxID=2925408 RepID=UPI001F56CCB7|nr:restriction endonuclease subunit S [Anaeromyxobacter sp. SG63]